MAEFVSNMAERPILFSGEMVRAILSGAKTQTRRPLTPQPYSNGFKYDRELGDILCHNDYLPPSAMLLDVGRGKKRYTTSDHEDWTHDCPFGLAGDRLWVRETYALIWPDEYEPSDIRENVVEYRADHPGKRYPGDWPDCPASESDSSCPKWRPSIHMPRWASRLTLEIAEVRVERLMDITEADALAEGVESTPYRMADGTIDDAMSFDARTNFAYAWDRIYGDRKNSTTWACSPWVWVLSFRRVESAARKAAAHG
jgi:hypothetical protein